MKIYYIKHQTAAKDFLGVGLNHTKQLRKVWAGAGPMKCAIRNRYYGLSLKTGLKDIKHAGYSIIEIDILTGQIKNVIDDWLNQV